MKLTEVTNIEELRDILFDPNIESINESVDKEKFNYLLMLLLEDNKCVNKGITTYSMGESGHIELDELLILTLQSNGFDVSELNKCTNMWYS